MVGERGRATAARLVIARKLGLSPEFAGVSFVLPLGGIVGLHLLDAVFEDSLSCLAGQLAAKEVRVVGCPKQRFQEGVAEERLSLCGHLIAVPGFGRLLASSVHHRQCSGDLVQDPALVVGESRRVFFHICDDLPLLEI